jgi:hypothetical protein
LKGIIHLTLDDGAKHQVRCILWRLTAQCDALVSGSEGVFEGSKANARASSKECNGQSESHQRQCTQYLRCVPVYPNRRWPHRRCYRVHHRKPIMCGVPLIPVLRSWARASRRVAAPFLQTSGSSTVRSRCSYRYGAHLLLVCQCPRGRQGSHGKPFRAERLRTSLGILDAHTDSLVRLAINKVARAKYCECFPGASPASVAMFLSLWCPSIACLSVSPGQTR